MFGFNLTNYLPCSLYWFQLRQTVLYKVIRGFLRLENAGIPHSKVTKVQMLIHPNFLVRMVQRRERNSLALIIKPTAQQSHIAQVNWLWLTIFDSFFCSKKRDLSLGRIKFLYTWSKSFRGRPNWVKQLKGLDTGASPGTSPTSPFFPSFTCQQSHFLTAGGHQQDDPLKYWDFFTYFCFNSAGF